MQSFRKKTFSLMLIIAISISFPLTAGSTVAGAKKIALAAAAAFVSEGFDVRNKYSLGYLERGESTFIRATLYAGNDYVLIAGGCEDAYDIDIKVYDENKHLIAEDRDARPLALVTVSPKWSGAYYIKVTMYKSTRNGAHWVLITGFK